MNIYFHRGIIEAQVDCQFEIIFKIMSNLQCLPMAKHHWNGKKMLLCSVYNFEAIDFASFCEFISNQQKGFYMKIDYGLKSKLNKWFEKSEVYLGKKPYLLNNCHIAANVAVIFQSCL